MNTKKLIHGWRPSMPDWRDLVYDPKRDLPSHQDNFLLVAHPSVAKTFPKQKFLTDLPPVYDQGQLGSCTANAIAAAHEYEQIKQNESSFTPSRLFIYYNERVMENTIKQDAGAQIRDGVKSISKLGVCPENNWTYNIKKFKTKPTKSCYKYALDHLALKYESVNQTEQDIKACLANGYPVIFGFSVYESFESDIVAKTGELNLPKKGEKLLGGHAVLCIGYDDNSKRFIIRNSWGQDWGLSGYFTMPYSYMTNKKLSSDFWKISLIK